jgi:hypothetical protein
MHDTKTAERKDNYIYVPLFHRELDGLLKGERSQFFQPLRTIEELQSNIPSPKIKALQIRTIGIIKIFVQQPQA